MRAISLWQPYLAGVVRGDGWVSPLTIGLRVKDRAFCEAFADALAVGHGITRRPRQDERGYWLLRVSNKRGTFSGLMAYRPSTESEWAAWLRGLFDSEGNANLVRQPQVSAFAFTRRVAIYSTDLVTLSMAAHGLSKLGLATVLNERRHTEGHKGSKPVYQLRLAHNRDAFAAFARLVGSSIPRKQSVLDAIPKSYQPAGHHSRIQAKGAAVRRARRDAGGKY